MPGPGSIAVPKPEPRKRAKSRTMRVYHGHVKETRDYVFARERGICRCCRIRAAESMHELRPKSLRGKVSKRNSVAVCGDGVRGCHGMLQRHEIAVRIDHTEAEGTVLFYPQTGKAADWMRIARYSFIESQPMREMETDL